MMHFLDWLFPPRDDEHVLRDIPLPEFLALLAPQPLPMLAPEGTALLPFRTASVRAAIHEAKYHGSGRAVEYLGAALAEYLMDADAALRNPVLIPVPLGAGRRRERGFNQAEEIVKSAVRMFACETDVSFLLRARETHSQVSLPRHLRLENMRGAFRAARAADPTRTHIVIDDVVTTGATLQAAIDALREAGARHVVPLALAH